MKKYLIVFTIAMLFVAANISYAQGFKIGVRGGLTIVQGPEGLTNDISNNATTSGAGFSTEYHFGAKGKISLPLIPITPIAFIDYYMLSGEGTVPEGTIETSQSIVSAGVGVEYTFAPGPISPYLSLTVASNSFGEFERKAPAALGGTTKTGGVTRVGIGVGLGAEVSIIPTLDIDATVSYDMLNLIGKESGEKTVGVINLNVAIALVSM